MDREFFCVKCGLLFWDSIDYAIKFKYDYKCPDCDNDQLVFACDTLSYAYFCEAHGDELPKAWSSEKYASALAIEFYKQNDVEIR